MTLEPQTFLGRASAWLIVAGALCLAVFFLFVSLGERGGDTFFANPKLAIPYLLAAACGIAAFGAGLTAILRRRERGGMVFLSTALGLVVLIWVGAEIVSPH